LPLCPQKKYDQLMEETKELTKTIQDRRDLKQQFKHRTDKLTQDLEDDKRSYGDQLANEKVKHISLFHFPVARKILELKKHQVDLGGECSITVEARPVHLMLPKLVEVKQTTTVSSQRILVSNLPRMETDTLLDKLEIHFSKSKNGGGEVADCEYLSDSETVVLTFAENNIAKRVVQNEFHDLNLQKKKHTVRVTPFINGKISNLKSKMTQCPRAVMLTGIPDIMERETLQDLLEIHFQKNTNVFTDEAQ
uniref:Interferon-induced protein 35 n=1 Tax=Neolamprologus brichardi TaxID=32507 RepID=A0A3Q4GXY7_NEOBR